MTEDRPDELNQRIYPLFCPECHKVSHKALIELILRNRLPCDHCGISIESAREYGTPRLEQILIGLGRCGFTIPNKEEID